MRKIRIYQNIEQNVGESVTLTDNACHHLKNVLKQKIGNEFIIFNNNIEYLSKIAEINKKSIKAIILSKNQISLESKVSLNLLIGIPKNDTMDSIVKKATEIGVSKITPIITEFSNFNQKKNDNEKKLEHWRAIAIAACEQCGRNIIPIIEDPKKFVDAIKSIDSENSVFLNTKSNTHLLRIIKECMVANNKISNFIIGPEGGFSDAETETINSLHIRSASLGRTTLRVETAVILSLGFLQALQEEI